MSSAKRSRDPPNPGNEPTEELGYPALVQYTFIPNDTESSEILVSGGDIVQLVYKVGGWVFVRTYEGKVGYIPFSFCKELESSKEVGSTYNETGFTLDSVDTQEIFNSKDSFVRKVPNNTEQLKHRRWFTHSEEKRKCEQPRQQSGLTRTEKRVHFADQPKSRNSCDICRNFLTSFSNIDHNTANAGQKKVNLKPHKLLKQLQTISKDGLVNIGNTKPTYNAQSFFGQITDNRINRRVNSSEFPIKFGNFCNQCDVLKDIFKNANRYSMSDLYSTIRNLHLNALTADSDSDQDEVSENMGEMENQNGQFQNDAHILLPGEKMPKRSISFKEPEVKQKVEIVRNNSFSGITEVERNDMVNGTIPMDGSNHYSGVDNLSLTAIECTRATRDLHSNNCIDSTNKNGGLRNHQINNYFPENQDSHTKPFSFDEDVTDFRAADYTPPLISKWRPVKETRSPEPTIQRPPGIVREQTFEYDSIKSKQKEVNFNDPKKENLNLTKAEVHKNHYVKMQNQMRQFTMDSRRKPIVSNGNFSLDENDDFESPEPKSSNLGAITKCFTTYGQSAHFQENGSTSKSLTLDRHFKHSSQVSKSETFDKVEQTPNRESVYKDYDNRFPKQTETDSVIDRRKIAARKVNPVTSPRSFMPSSGPLLGRKNDKDIRKSLLEHSAMKKTMSNVSEPMRAHPVRAQPMRAQHDIASPNEAALSSGRTVLVKKFNKQMWRPSLAGSEGSDQRPFSPFGGTLPPSKIVKKKVVEVFV